MVRWLSRLATQGRPVWSPVWKDPVWCGAAKPVCRAYWSLSSAAHASQWEKPPQPEKSPQWEARALRWRVAPLFTTRESPKSREDPGQFSRSIIWLLVTSWTAAHQASLSITNSQSLLKLMSIESVMPSNHLTLCCPLLLLPSVFAKHQGPSQWVSSSYQVAKGLEFQFWHQSFQWIFRTDFR